eukprot:TRINITY_DN97976_c0_g1_i1.p2 TRINITY_DN97976_c0_g1~~TRINITY_DN97976_c0_g1_i1.p2  ORF type:complete len:132 (-),score=9.40 TRINITY_DN97976_c0_g1_i1:249-644(-)
MSGDGTTQGVSRDIDGSTGVLLLERVEVADELGADAEVGVEEAGVDLATGAGAVGHLCEGQVDKPVTPAGRIGAGEGDDDAATAIRGVSSERPRARVGDVHGADIGHTDARSLAVSASPVVELGVAVFGAI